MTRKTRSKEGGEQVPNRRHTATESARAVTESGYSRPPQGGYFLMPEFCSWPDVQAAGPLAVGTYAGMGMWATRSGYDGEFYKHQFSRVGGTAAAARSLVKVGLWSKSGRGYGHVSLAQLQMRRGCRGLIMPVSRLFLDSPAASDAGTAAFGAWVIAASWSLTTPEPGFVTEAAVARFGLRRHVARLCAPNWHDTPLWEPAEGGYWMSRGTHRLEARWAVARDDERLPIPEHIRRGIHERDGYRCVCCGSANDLALDHIYPWSLGGSDATDNLQTLCRPCNSSKGARVLSESGNGRP